jgi:hypothetical protein
LGISNNSYATITHRNYRIIFRIAVLTILITGLTLAISPVACAATIGFYTDWGGTSSGVPGTVISLSGNGYDPGVAVLIWFDTDDDGIRGTDEFQVWVTTDASGGLTTAMSLEVPEVPVGNYSIRSDVSGDEGTVSTVFSVTGAGISASPESGAPDTEITVSGSNFAPDTPVWIWLDTSPDSIRNTGEVQVQVAVSAAGEIPPDTQLTLPAVDAGTYMLYVSGEDGAIEAYTSIEVTPPYSSGRSPSLLWILLFIGVAIVVSLAARFIMTRFRERKSRTSGPETGPE